jgi:hypothetical protein
MPEAEDEIAMAIHGMTESNALLFKLSPSREKYIGIQLRSIKKPK